jgi:hypothetical protein
MEGFTFATVLVLNKDYYHIKLDADADSDVEKLSTIVYCIPMEHRNPWNIGKYNYKYHP